ncbi:MAG TPA: peptide chain release factor 2 [Chloroflexota bacterium]|nr:peptide chain release factor 2 [Chloroflexota bacterium]
MEELLARLNALRERLDGLLSVFDLRGKQAQIAELEAQTADSSLWDDPQHATALLQRLNALKNKTARWETLSRRLDDARELLQMAMAEVGDQSELLEDLGNQLKSITRELDEGEFELMLDRPYADHNAVITITAGAGGVDAQDWTEMLTRMYLRWAERHGLKAELVDSTEGEEAGFKNATIEVDGLNAYGYLLSERGSHRLVRLSPFDSAHRRQTSFAAVEVLPAIDEGAPEIVVDPKDLRIDIFRATGAGGQNVNKVSSAVRMTHLPTGIVVTCQNERSQLQNREVAMHILQARLLDMELRRREEEQAKLRGEPVAAGFGNRDRSYVIHPYTAVKDERSGYETTDANAVLDGDLDPFMEAYLRSQVQG